MAEKRFYWLKLQCDFFQQKEMKKLRKMAGGATYTIIYLKMQLLSLNKEGVIEFESVEDSIEEELALVLDESTEDVQMTLLFLKKHGLIEEISDGEYLLPRAVESMGRESASAERVRRLRERKVMLQCDDTPLHCNAIVTGCNTDVTQSKRKEIEIEKEKDSESYPEIDILSGAKLAPNPQEPLAPDKEHKNIALQMAKQPTSDAVHEIITFLNLTLGTNYKASSKKTLEHINARLREGFTVDDFKAVILKKHAEWSQDLRMSAYLRPETLFGTKFEGYLNQPGSVSKSPFLDIARREGAGL